MPVETSDAAWIVSRRTGWRGLWGAVGVLVFGAAAAASVWGFVRAPHVDSFVLVIITIPFLVMAMVLAWEALGQGMVRLDGDGYSTPLGQRRRWSDVLALGTGLVEGRETPVVAVRSGDGFPVTQDVFPGFADAEASRLVEALRARVRPAGFEAIAVGETWWATAEAEADRAAEVARRTSGREPLSRERVEFGFPGVPSAVRLDYGRNDAGERVELLARQSSELAVTAHGRRWLRQNRKRSLDPAAQVGWLFEPHTTEVVASTGVGFDRLVVTVAGRKPLSFNAEEPDRFM